MHTSLPCHVCCSIFCAPPQVLARASLCSTKGNLDTSRPHKLLQAGIFPFSVRLLVLKQNPTLSFLSGLTVRKVKQKIETLEFEFGFLKSLF